MFEIKEVSDMDMVMGGKIEELLPPMQDIPDEFGICKKNKWSEFISDWVFRGIKELRLAPKDGVDPEKAIRHIRAIMSSFEPKHEHKEAGCAYLMSIWFDDLQYQTASRGRLL